MQHETTDELFGLAGTFPRPGWVVLDAARDRRFTGELVFDTSPPASVYFDRGHIYLAERATDPSLGARLVDAGALDAAQLERGAVRIDAIEHLGRLFERVPNLDRHTVIVTAELMTEACVGWLAVQRVPEVTCTPYRHHESGMHLWDRASGRDVLPGDPLPAPTAGAGPVSVTPPVITARRPIGDHTERFLDGLIEWDEPSWLDGDDLERELVEPPYEVLTDIGSSVPGDEPGEVTGDAHREAGVPPEVTGDGRPAEDWVDRLAEDGLPEADPLAPSTRLPRLPVEPVERFELVWPSGEVDEEFGAVDSVVGGGHDPDADRVGATARLGRPEAPVEAAVPEPETGPESGDAEQNGEAADEVVLAVRRAVASIEVGSLAARQRLADRNGELGGRGVDDPSGVPAPGRVAVRSGRNDWSRRTVTRSVFDEPISEPPAPAFEPSHEPDDHQERRAGALRRLIASLRR